MKPSFKKLQKIEMKANKLITFSRNQEKTMESKAFILLQRKWCETIEVLRGYSDFPDENFKHNSEWLAYCEKYKLNPNYDFGDVLA